MRKHSACTRASFDEDAFASVGLDTIFDFF